MCIRDSPHFLLNTLNNIYALIAFDSDKAQQAVQELSKLLRLSLIHIYHAEIVAPNPVSQVEVKWKRLLTFPHPKNMTAINVASIKNAKIPSIDVYKRQVPYRFLQTRYLYQKSF